MKNILTLLVAFVFAMITSAQTYQPAPNWGSLEVSRGVHSLTKHMSYNFADTVIRIIEINEASTFGNPNYDNYWQLQLDETALLVGQGIDVVTVDSLPFSSNSGWAGRVRLLDFTTGQPVVPSPILLFQNAQPEGNLQINIPDPLDYSGVAQGYGMITYDPNINTIFDPSDGETYVNRFYARLWKFGGGYDVTIPPVVLDNVSQAQNVQVSFTLPANISGQFCMSWWMTVDHVSVTPEYWVGENTVFFYQPPCFSYGMSTLVEDETKVEFNVYPNPFTGLVTVTSPEATEYRIIDLTGKQVLSSRFQFGRNELDLSNLVSGMYFLETVLDGQVNIERLIKE